MYQLDELLTQLAATSDDYDEAFIEHTKTQIRASTSAEHGAEDESEQVVDRRCREWLAEFSNEIRWAVTYAVVDTSKYQPSRMTALVMQWLQHHRSDHPVGQVGRRAVTLLLRNSSRLDAGQLETSAYPLLLVFDTILRTCDEFPSVPDRHDNLVRVCLTAIFDWHRRAIAKSADMTEGAGDDQPYEEDSELPASDDALQALAEARTERWEQKVTSVLLQAITEATQSQRALIRRALLSIWPRKLTKDTAQVHRVLRALLTRLHVMDGVPFDLPHVQRACLFVVDGEACARHRPNAFSLAQELSLLAPVVVMRLGDARLRYAFEPPGLQRDGAEVRQLTCSADLVGDGQPYPPLVMPLLQPYAHARWLRWAPSKTVFVAIYSTAPVIDLVDIADTAPPPAAEPAQKPSVFARPQAPAAPATRWPWKSKLLLVTPSMQLLPPALPPSLREHIQVLDGNADDECLARLLRNIGRSLHELTTADAMWCDLERYVPVDAQRTAAAVAVQVEQWLPLLPALQPAHPREDAAVTIAWSTLALARENCQQAVAMVAEMLCDDSGRTPTWGRHMGAACIRLLFNFYDAEPAGTSAARHKPLLQLLPALHRAAGDASDVYPVWLLLLKWAKSRDWGDLLLGTSAEAGALYVGLDNFRRQDAQWLRWQLDEYAQQEEIARRAGLRSACITTYAGHLPAAYRNSLSAKDPTASSSAKATIKNSPAKQPNSPSTLRPCAAPATRCAAPY